MTRIPFLHAEYLNDFCHTSLTNLIFSFLSRTTRISRKVVGSAKSLKEQNLAKTCVSS